MRSITVLHCTAIAMENTWTSDRQCDDDCSDRIQYVIRRSMPSDNDEVTFAETDRYCCSSTFGMRSARLGETRRSRQNPVSFPQTYTLTSFHTLSLSLSSERKIGSKPVSLLPSSFSTLSLDSLRSVDRQLSSRNRESPSFLVSNPPRPF